MILASIAFFDSIAHILIENVLINKIFILYLSVAAVEHNITNRQSLLCLLIINRMHMARKVALTVGVGDKIVLARLPTKPLPISIIHPHRLVCLLVHVDVLQFGVGALRIPHLIAERAVAASVDPPYPCGSLLRFLTFYVS